MYGPPSYCTYVRKISNYSQYGGTFFCTGAPVASILRAHVVLRMLDECTILEPRIGLGLQRIYI